MNSITKVSWAASVIAGQRQRASEATLTFNTILLLLFPDNLGFFLVLLEL